MAAAASSTTNWLSDTAISRLSGPFSVFSASTIDCVNARSFGALGAMTATFSGVTAGAGDSAADVAGGSVVLLLLPPPPQATATRATVATAAISATVLNLLISPPPSGTFAGIPFVVPLRSLTPLVRTVWQAPPADGTAGPPPPGPPP